MQLARERRYAEARKLLEGVPEPAGTAQRIAFHRLRAAVASGLGEAANAVVEMRAALALAPADPALLLATAAAELQAGRLDDALAHARAGGHSAAALALTGDIEDKRGQYVEAAKAYQAAVALDPASERYRLALALELVQHHTFDPAIAVLEQAAPLFPKSARIRTLLGVAQYAAGHYGEAEAALADALGLDPALEPAYRYLTQVALESSSAPRQRTVDIVCGWNAVACAALRSRAAQERNDPVLLQQAIEGLRRAPEGNAMARCELGRAYHIAGEMAKARVELEQCVKLQPSPQNHYRLGLVYARLGLNDLARSQMELRQAAADRLSDEVARRENAVQAFHYFVE